MEPARLASKQASSSKQARPTGPLTGPRATGVPKSKKKCYHAIQGGFPQLSQEQLFSRSDPHVVGNGDLLGVWPVLGCGHLEKFRARAESRKTQFPGARGTFGEKICPHQSFLPKIPLFFCILRFGRPDPQGQEVVKNGGFGLGQPLALGEIIGENTDCQGIHLNPSNFRC